MEVLLITVSVLYYLLCKYMNGWEVVCEGLFLIKWGRNLQKVFTFKGFVVSTLCTMFKSIYV